MERPMKTNLLLIVVWLAAIDVDEQGDDRVPGKMTLSYFRA
jgi:hypothetical protein